MEKRNLPERPGWRDEAVKLGFTFAYGFYAFFAIVSFFFVYFQVPETKGRELETMTDVVNLPRRGGKKRE